MESDRRVNEQQLWYWRQHNYIGTEGKPLRDEILKGCHSA
jgi:hypothetical protein